MQFEGLDNLNTEELALLVSLSEQLKFKLPTNKGIPLRYKVMLATVECKLCGTITVQYIKLVMYQEGLWIKDIDILKESVEEGMKIEEWKGRIGSCWACKDVFMQKSKEELVDKILKMYDPRPTRAEIWKKVLELKKSPLEGGR